jgi:chromosome segregation ATPase
LKDFEKEDSAKIQAAENGWKSAEAGLKSYERQVVEIQGKYDWELDRSSGLRGEISTLRDEVQKLQAEKQKVDDSA